VRENCVVPTTPPSATAALVGGPGYGTQVDFPLYPGLTCLRENPCRPYGARVNFPLYPALKRWLTLSRLRRWVPSHLIPLLLSKYSSHTDTHALG